MKFKGDIIITDPCYIMKGDDWGELSEYAERMDLILKTDNFLVSHTGIGDWSETVYNNSYSSSKGEIIGEFCADAGMVLVAKLEDVLKYNPEFDYHINRLWTTTLIKDFDGDVEIHFDSDSVAYIEGNGNIDFTTINPIDDEDY